MRFGKGLPLTAEQRAVHGIRADETLALHARIAELELAAKWEGDLAQQALDDLKKRDARIAELEHTSKCHVEGFVKQCEKANKKAHRIAELEAENIKLRTALKPFADAARQDGGMMWEINCSDLRAAAKAYVETKDE